MRGRITTSYIMNVLHHHIYHRSFIDGNFTTFIAAERGLDLGISDYLIQEESLAKAQLFAAKVIILLASTPVSEPYQQGINVPQNPSSYPSVLSHLPSRMHFLQRLQNLDVFLELQLARVIIHTTTRLLFSYHGHPEVDTRLVDEQHLLHVSQMVQLVLESPRPITNQVGGGLIMGISAPWVLLLQIKYFGSMRLRPRATSTFRSLSDITNITFPMGEPDKIILVTFGSIALSYLMPVEKQRMIFDAFAKMNYTIVWQYGSDWSSNNVTVPSNVHLRSWLPIKEVLGKLMTPEIIGDIAHNDQ